MTIYAETKTACYPMRFSEMVMRAMKPNPMANGRIQWAWTSPVMKQKAASQLGVDSREVVCIMAIETSRGLQMGKDLNCIAGRDY